MRGNALFHTLKVFTGLETPNSQTTQKEREAIKKYATGAVSAVEIGVYEGVNSINILSSMSPVGTLYAIDPFFRGRLGLSYSRMIARRGIAEKNYTERVKFIRKFSNDAVDDVPDGLDFIFIDGDHSYEGIRRDWEDWLPKVKKGGLILLHDTNIPDHDPSVANLGSYKYFQTEIKFLKTVEVLQIVDSLSILKKIEG